MFPKLFFFARKCSLLVKDKTHSRGDNNKVFGSIIEKSEETEFIS
jgi:hypothetical protein